MLDFHNHVIPGVDDGAADLRQAREALLALSGQGVDTIIATPHFDASLTLQPERFAARMDEIDRGYAALREIARADLPQLRLERGVELRLDTPYPDLSDARTRLAGSSFVLVEFAGWTMPPNAAEVLAKIVEGGHVPILAHPERYALEGVEWPQWARIRDRGCYLQVNSGSLLGQYGEAVQRTAIGLIERGWADYTASDYHARGIPASARCRERLVEMGGEAQMERLFDENPRRILTDEPPLRLAPLVAEHTLWARIRARFTR